MSATKTAVVGREFNLATGAYTFTILGSKAEVVVEASIIYPVPRIEENILEALGFAPSDETAFTAVNAILVATTGYHSFTATGRGLIGHALGTKVGDTRLRFCFHKNYGGQARKS